jgi:hypothetical protein
MRASGNPSLFMRVTRAAPEGVRKSYAIKTCMSCQKQVRVVDRECWNCHGSRFEPATKALTVKELVGAHGPKGKITWVDMLNDPDRSGDAVNMLRNVGDAHAINPLLTHLEELHRREDGGPASTRIPTVIGSICTILSRVLNSLSDDEVKALASISNLAGCRVDAYDAVGRDTEVWIPSRDLSDIRSLAAKELQRRAGSRQEARLPSAETASARVNPRYSACGLNNYDRVQKCGRCGATLSPL